MDSLLLLLFINHTSVKNDNDMDLRGKGLWDPNELLKKNCSKRFSDCIYHLCKKLNLCDKIAHEMETGSTTMFLNELSGVFVNEIVFIL